MQFLGLLKSSRQLLTERCHVARLYLRGFRSIISTKLLIVFALLALTTVGFQVWTSVILSRSALLNSETLANRNISQLFAERLHRYSEQVDDQELRRVINDLSMLNRSVRLYILDQHGIITISPELYGRPKLPFIDLHPAKRFLSLQGSQESVLGDDPHQIGSLNPISVRKLRLKGGDHYVYVVLAPILTAQDSLFAGWGIGVWALATALISVAVVIIIMLFISYYRVQGLQFSLAALSHDLRAPLSSVQGYLETILERGERLQGADSKRFMSVALRSTRSATNMVNDLHQLSLLESSGNAVAMEPVSIGDLAMDTIIAAKPLADEKKISLSCELAPSLPLASGNIPLLERLVRNLVENAIRYTPNGGRIELVVDTAHDKIRITVSDSGLGIPKAELEKVSQAFYRGSNTKRATTGSGIGLSICSKIAQIHGSNLRILSRENEGTAVIFEIAQMSVAN